MRNANLKTWLAILIIRRAIVSAIVLFLLFPAQTTFASSPDMVYIPGGSFQMGDSFNEGWSDELPVHTVTLDSFYMGKYEVTNQQYCQYLNSALGSSISVSGGEVYGSGNNQPYCDTSTSNSYSQISYSGGVFSVRTKGGRNMSNDPMVCVTWYGAAAYCNWRSQQEGKEQCYNLSTWACDFNKHGYRLATEAEWEYAARGGLSGKRFPWGDTISHSQANYYSLSAYSYDISPTRGYHPTWNDGISPYTSPVGSFSANGYGVYDMAGNAWEQCNDWYSSTYYSSSPPNNPTGQTSGSYRVLRGGGWPNYAHDCRVARRGFVNPGYRAHDFGFRLSLKAEEPPPGFFSLKRNLLIEHVYPTHDGFFTDVYFLSGLSRALMNTQDPLWEDSPFVGVIGDDLQNRLFGSTVETESGWIDLSQGLSFTGYIEKGQWSRLGQVINPSFGFLLTEAEFGTQEWRLRQLVTDAAGVFEYHSNDVARNEENMTISLVYGWRCLGLAKSGAAVWWVNNIQNVYNMVSGGLGKVVTNKARKATILFVWNANAEKIGLYKIGVDYLPDDSSFKAWTSTAILFEKQDGTSLGSFGPILGGWWPHADPLKDGLYDSGGQARCEPQSLTLPVGESITVRLHFVTHAEAKGAAESYAGILGYELRIDGPDGTNPLIFSGTDPSPNDLDLSKGFGSSLLQAAETEAFVIGHVRVEESFGESNSVNDTGVVVLPIDTNSPVSGIFIPVYLVPQTKTIRAHVDAYWSDGSDLSNTCVEFMLVDDANNLRINGGLAPEIFGDGEPVEPVDGLNRHSGEYDLTLDVSHLSSGNYVLAVIYGEPNYSEPNSCLVIQGLSVEVDPNIKTSIVGDVTMDGKVDWADLKELCDSWLSPVPIAEKDLYPDGVINFKDFAVLAENWLKSTIPADLDIDGDVDFGDYASFANHWMDENCAEAAWCEGADLNKNGSVDLYDLAEFSEHWLEGTH